MRIHHFVFIFKRIIFVLILLIVPLSGLPTSLDMTSLLENRYNLITAAGTMAALSLVFLFERADLPTLSSLFIKIVALTSILYFVFASIIGLMYETGTGIICLRILFLYTFSGIICLAAIGVALSYLHFRGV